MNFENEFYEELQVFNKFERYANKLASKYFVENFEEDVKHFKSRLLSACYDKGEAYRINKKSSYKEMLEILKDKKDSRHKNLINYVLINAFHKIEEEEADHQGKIKVGGEWVESPIMYTDRIENGQEDELKYEDVYVAPDTINRDDVTLAKEIAFQFLRKNQFEFVTDVFELTEAELLEKYNYPNMKMINRRINRIAEALEQHRDEINEMIETKQEKWYKANIKIVDDLLNEVMNGTDESFAMKLYEYRNADVISEILVDNIVLMNEFLEMCSLGCVNEDTYKVVNALHDADKYLNRSLARIKQPRQATKFPVNVEALKRNQERHAKYNEFIKPSDILVYDSEGNFLRRETPDGKLKEEKLA